MKKSVKIALFVLAVAALPLLVAAGPPVPSTWYRAGSVTLGNHLYFTDILTGASSTGTTQALGLPLVHEVTSDDVSVSSGAFVLPVVQYPGRFLIVGNTTATANVLFGASGASINGNAANASIPLGASSTRICVSASTSSWLCD